MRHTRKAGMDPVKSRLSKRESLVTRKNLSKNAEEFVPQFLKPLSPVKPLFPKESIKRMNTVSKTLHQTLTREDWIEIDELIPFDTTIEFTDKNDIVILFNAYQRPGNPMSIEGHISGLHITQHPGGSFNRKGAFHLKLAYNHNGVYHNIYYRIFLFGSESEKFVVSISRNLLKIGELYIDMESDFELKKLPAPIIQELSRFIYIFASSFGDAFSTIYLDRK